MMSYDVSRRSSSLSQRLHLLIVLFLSTSFSSLDIIVLVSELVVGLLAGKNLFDESLLALLVGESRREVFGRTFDDGAHLRVFRNFCSCRVLFVETFGVQNISETDELQVAFELRSYHSFGHVVPLCASSSLFCLFQ